MGDTLVSLKVKNVQANILINVGNFNAKSRTLRRLISPTLIFLAGRSSPTCTLGHLMKALFKNDNFMNKVIMVSYTFFIVLKEILVRKT